MTTLNGDKQLLYGGASMLHSAALEFGVQSSLHNHVRSVTAAALIGPLYITAGCAPLSNFNPSTATLGDCRQAIVKILATLFKEPA